MEEVNHNWIQMLSQKRPNTSQVARQMSLATQNSLTDSRFENQEALVRSLSGDNRGKLAGIMKIVAGKERYNNKKNTTNN